MNFPKGFKKNKPRKRGHDRKCSKCGRYCYPNYFYCTICHAALPTTPTPVVVNSPQTPNRRGFD